MPVILDWNYGQLDDVKQVRIERSSDFEGPYVELVTLEFPTVQYVDAGGAPGVYYRFVMIFTDDTESEPTLPKKVTSPPLCRVFGYVLSITGKPVGGEIIRFSLYPHTLPQIQPGFATSTIVKEVETGRDGFFQIDLLQGAVVDITCIRLGINYKERVVPSVDVKEFGEWVTENQ